MAETDEPAAAGTADPSGGTKSGQIPLAGGLALIVCLVHLAGFTLVCAHLLAGRHGLLVNPTSPVGDDFINLWTTAQFALSGAIDQIYNVKAFMAFQQSLVHSYIGLRLWAYPPQSLLLVWPFGALPYFFSLGLWTILGLTVLGAGARRYGMSWIQTVVLVLSPAALMCVYDGQTGNVFAGLMLMALAPRSRRDPLSVTAAALMTIKPQTGFLLPLAWLKRRHWVLIAATAATALLLAGLSALIFGIAPWQSYVQDTVPVLSRLERTGTGPFTVMIPSVFMSLRLLGLDGNLALGLHAVFALVAFGALVWRLARTPELDRQAALVLVATCLITPYLHVYDLGLLLAGGLLMFRSSAGTSGWRRWVSGAAIALSWIMPYLVYVFGLMKVPLSPLVILFVFLAI